MAPQLAKLPSQNTQHKRWPKLDGRSNTRHSCSPASELPRRSNRLRQQHLPDGNGSQPAQQARFRKRGLDNEDGAEAEQHVKRARRTTNGRTPAYELPSSGDQAVGLILPLTEPAGCAGVKRRRIVIPPEHESDEAARKRRRTSLAESVSQDALSEEAEEDTEDNWRAILHLWIREGRWPKKYFQPCLNMDYLFARKKSSPSLSRKRSSSASSVTPSDQRPREEKYALYKDPRYEVLLGTKGVYMDESPMDITKASKDLCKTLLEKEGVVPKDSLFRDDIFKATRRKLQGRNEARVIQDISRLLVPSAETFTTYGADHLKDVIESVNEGWNNSVPLTRTRPQPDYSVGFRREAFSNSQLAKLAPFIGNWLGGDQSFFMATYYMFFPFLACEVKCGVAALDVADRQNAHSMTVAARAVFELFRLVGRETEVDRQILSFSISHDHRAVRIYGYYPVIDGKGVKYYRYPIREFSFIELNGKEKWTAYQFTKNVYDLWMPSHFASICDAIDQIPSDIDFSVDPLPETGLSQGIESLSASASSQSAMSPVDPHFATPQSSLQGAASRKRSKKT